MFNFQHYLAGGARKPDPDFHAVLNALPDGVLVLSPDYTVLFANTEATALLPDGISENIASPADFHEHYVFLDPATGRAAPSGGLPVARAFRGETVNLQEYLVRRKRDAARHWVELSARPLLDAAGSVQAVVVTLRGIDERKKRQLVLEEAGRLNAILYQENFVGILQVTVDGRILDCNEALVRILGYNSKQDVLAMRAPRIYYDPSERTRIVRRLSIARRLNELEVRFRRSDGSPCWVLLSSRLLESPPGEVGGTIVSTVVDISRRKQQESILRQSEERFAAFMYHLPGIAFIKDADGRYLYFNEAAWNSFGIRPESIVGKTEKDIWPENATRSRQEDLLVIASGRADESVHQVTHPDGLHSWLVTKFPIVEHERVSMVCGIGIDITERANLQEQLAQARKMEALGRLAGGVAHDFNNLLTVIAGYSQLALESLGSVSEERIFTYLREILDSSRRASALTGQLLAFSRHEPVQPKVFNLSDLLLRMDRLLQRVIGEHVEVSVKCASDECLVHADASQMEQAIMNLAVNARDAMPLGGQLTLRCERLGQPLQFDGAEPLSILLEVSDNGIGMDEAVRSQIFDPFYTSKEAGKGTGLGLSTVYAVVTQAGGRIHVESAPGEGTTFRLHLPEAAASAEPDKAVRPPGVAGGTETVLLVEDESSVRMLAETILKRLGYNVLVAESGPVALKLWEEHSEAVDILLTDVIMPQMSGGELAHQLRRLNPRIRVLFMSGYTEDMIAGHGLLSDGDTQLIQKPFTAEGLSRKLRAVLDA